MKCRIIKKNVSAYVDDELPPGDREVIAAHMGECQECRQLYEEMFAIHSLYINASRYNAPHGLSDKVMANIAADAVTRGWGFSLAGMRFFLRLAEIALVFIILIVGSVSGYIVMMNGHGLERLPRLEEALFLDVFKEMPPDSLGSAYLTVIGRQNHEK